MPSIQRMVAVLVRSTLASRASIHKGDQPPPTSTGIPVRRPIPGVPTTTPPPAPPPPSARASRESQSATCLLVLEKLNVDGPKQPGFSVPVWIEVNGTIEFRQAGVECPLGGKLAMVNAPRQRQGHHHGQPEQFADREAEHAIALRMEYRLPTWLGHLDPVPFPLDCPAFSRGCILGLHGSPIPSYRLCLVIAVSVNPPSKTY